MDLLMIGQYYYDDQEEYLNSISRIGISVAHQKFQTNVYNGLRSVGNNVTFLSVLPMGNFPAKIRVPYSRGRTHPDGGIEVGSVNLPGIKHFAREKRLYSEILKWAGGDASSKAIVIYDLYIPFLKAAVRARQKTGVRVFVIVPDIPGRLNVEYGSYNLLTRIYKDRQARESVELMRQTDGAFLLTSHMAEALDIKDKHWMVLEGMVDGFEPSVSDSGDKVFLYSGQLNEQVGLRDLLNVWDLLTPDYKLYLCGNGTMEDEVTSFASSHSNVKFLGFLGKNRMSEVEKEASFYINPRKRSEIYTRYSFPSKTLEYIKTGKPVISYKLDGIPDEYDSILFYPDDDSAEALVKKITEVSALSPEELKAIGEKQRRFIETKTTKVQCARMTDFMREVTAADMGYNTKYEK